MGCCIGSQDKFIKSSNIPLLYQESLEIGKENNFQQNSNIASSIINPKQKMESNKTSNLKNQKGKNKSQLKNIKTMNILKNISFNEVNESTKYFKKIILPSRHTIS